MHNIYVITLVLTSLIPLADSQSVQTPYMTTPSVMVEGKPYSIICNSVSTGATHQYSWWWTSQLSPVTKATTCDPLVAVPNSYACRSTFDFTADRYYHGKSLMCIATTTSGTSTKNDTSTMYIIVEPPSNFPILIGASTVEENVSNTWTCTADGSYPAAIITWEVGSNNIIVLGKSIQTKNAIDNTYKTVSTISWTFQSQDNSKQLKCLMTFRTGSRFDFKIMTVQYLPVISAFPSSYTLTEGISGYIDCSIQALPRPSQVDWLKDGSILDRTSGRFVNGNSIESPTLTINNPQAADAGTYICTATNAVGNANGPNVTVVVVYSPKLEIPDVGYIGDIGEILEIPCNINSNPPITSLSWLRVIGGSPSVILIPSGGKYAGGTKQNTTLTIYNLQRSDSTDYHCEGTNFLGTRNSNAVTVSVSYAPTGISVDNIAPNVNEGVAVVVTCSANGLPTPTFTWYRGSDSIPIHNGATLSIPSTTPSNNGQYTCWVSNRLGNSSIIIAIKVNHRPILEVSKVPIDINKGTTMLLLCEVTAIPTLYTLSWEKNSIPVDNSDSRISGGNRNTPNLMITGVVSTDAGTYHCVASNQLGQTTSNGVVISITFPPENIGLSPSGQVHSLDEHDNLTLTCHVDATPAATYIWKFGNQLITSGPTYTITLAGPSDMRDVTCEATNSKGTIKILTSIQVRYTPRVTIPGGSSFGVDEGNRITIPCQVDSNPDDDTFQWLKDSSVLDLSDTTKYGGGTSVSRGLTIFSLSSADAGKYSCKAVNVMGTETSREVLVTISFAPKDVVITPSAFTTTEGGNISVTCSSGGVPSPTFIWLRNGETFQNGATLTINNAGPEHDVSFTCRAANGKGSSETNIDVTVTYKPRSAIGFSVVLTIIGGRTTLSCVVSANPDHNIRYEWKFNGATLSETSSTLSVTPASALDFGQYTCHASNSVGRSDPIVFTLQEGTPTMPGGSTTTTSGPRVGASTAGLSTSILVLIVVLFVLLLIIAIVVIAVCYKKGKCRRKDPKGRVAPVVSTTTTTKPTTTATTDTGPPAVEKPMLDNKPSDTRLRPQWSAVSRKDVHVNVNNTGYQNGRISVGGEEPIANGSVPNGVAGGGPIITPDPGFHGGRFPSSIYDDKLNSPRPHQLPPLHYGGGEDTDVEKKKNKKKKRRKRQDEETLGEDTIEEE